ncbi:glycosyltransferase family 25 protein [Defluviimonas sp. WL0024]|uniref:Glycosyltransferase family 25 protein n=1 Tax=Albidovulum salinarum TaxID=2984153 RepID=A0ABT2WXS9_9RHOB|nr:glycosyltransferase family 25 protein [Defluviimonas sp. WL0024]MCU9846481.1 glycosyltransferase family 25 protein [Defluviimonas sp. WL0024]
MTVEALVISLRSAAARRAMQEAQLGRLGLPHRLLDAVNAAGIQAADLARWQRAWCRPLRASEIACALSHRQAWSEVAAGTQPRLILEDDAVLGPATAAVLDVLQHRSGLDCVTLETFTLPKLLGRRIAIGATGHMLAEVFRDSAGAAAYLLWPDGARRLLASLPGLLPPADAAINLTVGLRMYQVEPACAMQAIFLPRGEGITPEVAETTISNAPRPKVDSAGDWLRYKLRRLRVSAILLRKRLRGLGRSQKRIVEFRIA